MSWNDGERESVRKRIGVESKRVPEGRYSEEKKQEIRKLSGGHRRALD